jgi:hypothetical protein
VAREVREIVAKMSAQNFAAQRKKLDAVAFDSEADLQALADVVFDKVGS